MTIPKRVALGVAAVAVPAVLMLAVLVLAVPFGVSSPVAPVPGAPAPKVSGSVVPQRGEDRSSPSPGEATPGAAASPDQRQDRCLEPEHRADPAASAVRPPVDPAAPAAVRDRPAVAGEVTTELISSSVVKP